jgi:hypothetical protein
MAEALGYRPRGQRRQLTEGVDPEPLEHLGEPAELGPRAQRGDGEWGEKAGQLGLRDDDLAAAAGPGHPGGHQRSEALRRGPQADARPELAPGGGEDAAKPAPV